MKVAAVHMPSMKVAAVQGAIRFPGYDSPANSAALGPNEFTEDELSSLLDNSNAFGFNIIAPTDTCHRG